VPNLAQERFEAVLERARARSVSKMTKQDAERESRGTAAGLCQRRSDGRCIASVEERHRNYSASHCVFS
jgi:hypothetical protein